MRAFEAGIKAAAPVELMAGVVLHHKDFAVADKAKERLAERKRSEPGPVNPAAVLVLLTLESFARAVTTHRDERTEVFADSERAEITAVFDSLEGGGQGDPDLVRGGWGQHRARIGFAESRKLGEWKKTTQWMGQEEFANFLEDHMEDVVEPKGQDLLSIATDLEASSRGNFKGRVNLANGTVSLCYQDEVETTVAVPRHLTLGIPLFEHGDCYALGARLRYLVKGGTVQFKLLFTNLEDAKEQEFELIVQELDEKAIAPLYRGRLVLPW